MTFVDLTQVPEAYISSYYSERNTRQGLAYFGIFPVKDIDLYSVISDIYNDSTNNGFDHTFFGYHSRDISNIRELYDSLKEKGLLDIDPYEDSPDLPGNKNFIKKVEKGFIASVLYTMHNSNFFSYYSVKEIQDMLKYKANVRWIVSYESGDLYANSNVIEALGYSRFQYILSEERKNELFEDILDKNIQTFVDNNRYQGREQIIEQLFKELDQFKSFCCMSDTGFKPFVPDILPPL